MKKILMPSMTLLLFLSACSQSSEPTPSKSQEHTSAPVMKYTVGSNDWSDLMAYSPKDNVREAYQFAVDHPEVLNYMPCYCGCYEDDGHTSNTDCFVDNVENGVAILDHMGLGWGICVNIAREAKQEFEKDTDLKSIREMIDSKYSGSDVEPTPTPMPQA